MDNKTTLFIFQQNTSFFSSKALKTYVAGALCIFERRFNIIKKKGGRNGNYKRANKQAIWNNFSRI